MHYNYYYIWSTKTSGSEWAVHASVEAHPPSGNNKVDSSLWVNLHERYAEYALHVQFSLCMEQTAGNLSCVFMCVCLSTSATVIVAILTTSHGPFYAPSHHAVHKRHSVHSLPSSCCCSVGWWVQWGWRTCGSVHQWRVGNNLWYKLGPTGQQSGLSAAWLQGNEANIFSHASTQLWCRHRTVMVERPALHWQWSQPSAVPTWWRWKWMSSP